jgi:AmiR/NasT family two-component response regulator
MPLYGSRLGAFDAAAELVVPVFAARAAIAVAHADQVAHLQRAVQSRQVIGQAVGTLMERHRLTAKQAFATAWSRRRRSSM